MDVSKISKAEALELITKLGITPKDVKLERRAKGLVRERGGKKMDLLAILAKKGRMSRVEFDAHVAGGTANEIKRAKFFWTMVETVNAAYALGEANAKANKKSAA